MVSGNLCTTWMDSVLGKKSWWDLVWIGTSRSDLQVPLSMPYQVNICINLPAHIVIIPCNDKLLTVTTIFGTCKGIAKCFFSH